MLVGCAALGEPRVNQLPADAHARPAPREVEEHPCRYGDSAGCIAKCERDDPQACNGAGVLFEFGENPDLVSASGYYRRSCDGSYAPGCDNLGWLYLRGRGVPQDQPQAMVLFLAAFDAARFACLRGDGSGCLLAGEILYDGRGVKEDEEQAVAFFRRGCDDGERVACKLAARGE
jgi:TPR repeat protein